MLEEISDYLVLAPIVPLLIGLGWVAVWLLRRGRVSERAGTGAPPTR